MNTLGQPMSAMTDPLHVVVMGVSGCGKSTLDRIGDYLAQATPSRNGRVVACSALNG